MVGIADAPSPVAVRLAPAAQQLSDDSAVAASIAAYLGAGEHMQTLVDLTWKIGAVLFVLVALAWLLGVLPIAVKLF
jgi:hypothetical protein